MSLKFFKINKNSNCNKTGERHEKSGNNIQQQNHLIHCQG